MKVVIIQSFEAYPNGEDKDPVAYLAGDREIEVPDDFGKLIIGKGHAKAASASAPSSSSRSKPAAPAAGDA